MVPGLKTKQMKATLKNMKLQDCNFKTCSYCPFVQFCYKENENLKTKL